MFLPCSSPPPNMALLFHRWCHNWNTSSRSFFETCCIEVSPATVLSTSSEIYTIQERFNKNPNNNYKHPKFIITTPTFGYILHVPLLIWWLLLFIDDAYTETHQVIILWKILHGDLRDLAIKQRDCAYSRCCRRVGENKRSVGIHSSTSVVLGICILFRFINYLNIYILLKFRILWLLFFRFKIIIIKDFKK